MIGVVGFGQLGAIASCLLLMACFLLAVIGYLDAHAVPAETPEERARRLIREAAEAAEEPLSRDELCMRAGLRRQMARAAIDQLIFSGELVPEQRPRRAHLFHFVRRIQLKGANGGAR